MIKPEVKEILEGIGATPFGKALQSFLDDQFDELNNVQACTSWEDTLARQHAVKILENLFGFMKIRKTVEKVKSQYT